MLLHQKQHHC